MELWMSKCSNACRKESLSRSTVIWSELISNRVTWRRQLPDISISLFAIFWTYCLFLFYCQQFNQCSFFIIQHIKCQITNNSCFIWFIYEMRLFRSKTIFFKWYGLKNCTNYINCFMTECLVKVSRCYSRFVFNVIWIKYCLHLSRIMHMYDIAVDIYNYLQSNQLPETSRNIILSMIHLSRISLYQINLAWMYLLS